MREQQHLQWHNTCREVEDHDTCNFTTLFHADPTELTEQQVADLMQHFPHRDTLVNRIMDVFKLLWHPDNSRLEDSQMLQHAENHVKEMLRLCEEMNMAEEDEDYDFNKWNSLTAVMVDDTKAFEKLRCSTSGPSIRFEETINDVFYDMFAVEDSKHYCLSEALYGLCSDFNLRRYIMTPLMKKPVNFRPYYELCLGGGNYVVDEKNILVCRTRN